MIIQYVHCETKPAPFYNCNNFVKSLYNWDNYWYMYTVINLEQNDIKIINLLWRVSLYCLVKCNVLWPTSVLSMKLC